MRDNGFELSHPVRYSDCVSKLPYQDLGSQSAYPTGLAEARACVKSPIFPASTGQRPTFYTLRLIIRELTLVNKRIFAFFPTDYLFADFLHSLESG